MEIDEPMKNCQNNGIFGIGWKHKQNDNEQSAFGDKIDSTTVREEPSSNKVAHYISICVWFVLCWYLLLIKN